MQRNSLKIDCLTDESFVYIRKRRMWLSSLGAMARESAGGTECFNNVIKMGGLALIRVSI